MQELRTSSRCGPKPAFRSNARRRRQLAVKACRMFRTDVDPRVADLALALPAIGEHCDLYRGVFGQTWLVPGDPALDVHVSLQTRVRAS
jgi:hypothetical protein